MDTKNLEKVIELLKKHQLSEIDITVGKEHIRVAANTSSAVSPYMSVPIAGYNSAPQPAHEPAATNSDTSAVVSHKTAVKIKGHVVKSPFIGNYYEAAAPGSEPFVKVGDRVKKGQPLCIVEAMKLMNEIESDTDGVVTKVFLKNEDPVEFDQDLFIIE